jgi:hypothetical protein
LAVARAASKERIAIKAREAAASRLDQLAADLRRR